MPPGKSPEDEHQATLDALARGFEVLFEPGIAAGGSHVRLDVLAREDQGLALFEVKQSTGSNPDKYIDDLAYQALVAQEAGLDIKRTVLLCLDPAYTLQGELDPRSLFHEIDMSDEVHAALPEIEQARKAIFPVPDGTVPEIEPGKHCTGCPFVPHCFASVPQDSLLYMPSVNTKKIIQFREEGWETIPQLDRSVLTGRQALTFDAVLAQGTVVAPGLERELAKIAFPAAFVDFETLSEAVPRIQGFPPFKQLPFQWSCHILRHAGAEPEHHEWLDESRGDCRAEFVRTLALALEGTATFVHYSAYEHTQLGYLSNDGVPGATNLAIAAKKAAFDLEKAVKDFVAHPGFQGRSSIKAVLPVLCPGLGYDGLEIAGGDAAQAAYARLVMNAPPSEREMLRRALLAYCHMDTLAMVELYRALLALARA